MLTTTSLTSVESQIISCTVRTSLSNLSHVTLNSDDDRKGRLDRTSIRPPACCIVLMLVLVPRFDNRICRTDS